MSEADRNLDLYKTPSAEILQHRREFYGMSRRYDDQSGPWLSQVQRQLNRCQFPELLSREYLLIDRFVCELNSNARGFVQSVDSWTLAQLEQYFVDQNIVSDHRVNVSISIDSTIEDENQEQSSSSAASPSSLLSVDTTECEFVSYSED